MKRALILGTLAVAAVSCSEPQTFVGTWKGVNTVPYLGSVSTTCSFNEADVMCTRISSVSHTTFGGAYIVKDSTTAVAPTAGFDFRRISSNQITFNNSSVTITLTKVDGKTAGVQTADR